MLALLVLSLSACIGSDEQEATVCDLPDGLACDACYTSNHRCAYDGVEVVAPSCDGCQARIGLYEALCDEGYTETIAAVDAAMVCTDVSESE